MSHSFNNAESYLFTSESVTGGHPDKLCDQDFGRGARRHTGTRPHGPRGL